MSASVTSRAPRDGRALLSNYAAVGVLVAFIVFFSITEPGTFPTTDNIKSIISSQSVLGLLALAAILPLVVGEFDISVANNLGLSAVLMAKLSGAGVPVVPAILIVLAAGIFIGAVNALLVVRIGLNSFVATLGTSVILTGFATLTANGATLYEGIGDNVRQLGTTTVGFIPIGGIYVVVAALVLWWMLTRTALGRELYATGYGRDGARLAGIRVERRMVLAFVGAGAFAAAAGVLNTASLGSASAGAGAGFLLPAFAAAFLGATTIQAGRYNVWGTIVGVVLLAVGITGLQLAGADTYVQDFFNGAALIVSVTLAQLGQRRMVRAGEPRPAAASAARGTTTTEPPVRATGATAKEG